MSDGSNSLTTDLKFQIQNLKILKIYCFQNSKTVPIAQQRGFEVDERKDGNILSHTSHAQNDYFCFLSNTSSAPPTIKYVSSSIHHKVKNPPLSLSLDRSTSINESRDHNKTREKEIREREMEPEKPAKDVSLQELRDMVAEFARVRGWEQYHSPRNLLLALVII